MEENVSKDDSIVSLKTQDMAISNTGPSRGSWSVQTIRFLYLPLFILTLFVNKYVLSVLKFTYPTIFQGWQMMAGAVVLKCLSLGGFMSQKPSLRKADSASVKFWIPALFFHVISIYTGSVSLSRMPVPLFLVFHNVISVIAALVDLQHTVKNFSNREAFSMILIVITLVMAVASFPGDLTSSATWATVHIFSTGLYLYYEKEMENFITLGALLLAPFTYLLGDLLEAREYPFLYFYRFYVGCFASGLFGSLAGVLAVKLKEKQDFPGCVSSVAKVVASLLSLFIFDWVYSGFCLLWILLNLLSNVSLKYLSAQRSRESSIKITNSEELSVL